MMNIQKEKQIECSPDQLLGREAEPIAMRLFNTLSGTTVMGIVIEETDDSFLVALPSRLLTTDGVFHVEPYLPLPFARFLKYTILNVTPIFLEFELPYIKYILEVKDDLLPSYFPKWKGDLLEERLVEVTESYKTVTATEDKAAIEEENINGTETSTYLTSGSKYKH